jgi:glycosyltransferase involved in cell wall biosynthesis
MIDTPCAARYDHAYAITQYGVTKRQEYGVSQEKMSLIHNCVDLDYFGPERECGRSSKWRFLMTAGRHVPHKDVENAIQAFRVIRRSVSELSLAVVGKGLETERLQKAVGETSSNIHFLGKISDPELGRYYRKAELF